MSDEEAEALERLREAEAEAQETLEEAEELEDESPPQGNDDER